MNLPKIFDQVKLLDPQNRLHNCPIPIIGLTGGIASGKSTASAFLKSKGYKVIDADALVKEIYNEPETFDFIKNLDSQFVSDGKINFTILREKFFSNPFLKNEVENFLYQRIPNKFLSQIKDDDLFVIYDVPLLFEKKLDSLIDTSILIYCPRKTQLERLLVRDQISTDLANKILDNQMDIELKKQISQFVIHNDQDQEKLFNKINELLIP